MTTVLIEEDVKLDKYCFKTIEEFEQYLYLKKKNEKLDLNFVDDENVPEDVLQMVKLARNLPEESFTNI